MKSVFEKERLAWMALSVVLLFVALNVSVRSRRDLKKSELRSYHLEKQLAESKESLNVVKSKFLDDSEVSDLKKKGLRNPAADLAADLQKHPELIPHKGVLGGTMGFGGTDFIRILSGHWALADFDDGHILGKALLKYSVSRKGKIKWKVVDSYLL